MHPLRLAGAVCAATAVLTAASVTVAPLAAADAALACPTGQTGVYVAPGTYPVGSVPGFAADVPQRSIALVTVHDPGGSATTFYLNLPRAFVAVEGADLSLVVSSPGLGVCVAPGTPNVYLAFVSVSSSGSVLPAAGSSGTTLVVSADNMTCSGIPLLVEKVDAVVYEATVDVRPCGYAFALTPLV